MAQPAESIEPGDAADMFKRLMQFAIAKRLWDAWRARGAR
jgi:hypothetical protein